MTSSHKLILLIAALAALLCLCSASFEPDRADNNLMVGYWGQDSSGSEANLASYCADSTYDIIVIGFAPQFGIGGDLLVNFAGHCWQTFPGSQLLNCPQIGQDIKTCQSRGKRIFLSIGGADGTYGLSSSEQASHVAHQLWNMFLGGSSSTRPFGNAIIDGIDLDIESGNPSHYGALVNVLSNLFKQDSSRRYYLSAAPQCPFPDAYDGPYTQGSALDQGKVDFIWVQFYNNLPTCGLAQPFNYYTWANWAKQHSPKTRVVVGALGASSGGAGFVDAGTLTRVLNGVRWDSQFGGAMVWDVSLAAQNGWAVQVSKFLKS